MGHESYIASQGPLAHTLEDFWRMIIQYSVKVIAMACQVVEMGKVSHVTLENSAWVLVRGSILGVNVLPHIPDF